MSDQQQPRRNERAIIGVSVLVAVALIIVLAVTLTLVRPKTATVASLTVGPENSSGVIDTPEGVPVVPSQASKSTAPTSSVDASRSAGATATADASGTVLASADASDSAVGGQGGGGGSDSDGPGDGSGDGGTGGDGSGDNGTGDNGTGDNGDNGGVVSEPARVTGSVYHEVWGTPLSGVRIAVTPGGGSDRSAGDGSFSVDGLDAGATPTTFLISVDGPWRSHSATSRTLALGSGQSGTVGFFLYENSEASGARPLDARGWRDRWSSLGSSERSALARKVGWASREFDGIGSGAVAEVLRGSGGNREKARAEFLALWLSLADSRLGFETTVDVSGVRGWAGLVPSADSHGRTTGLALARDLDRAFSDRDADWRTVERLCTANVIGAGAAASAPTEESPTTPGAGGAGGSSRASR